MRRVIKYFLITSLIAGCLTAPGAGKGFAKFYNNKAEKGNTALNADIPEEQMSTKGALKNLASVLSSKVSSLSDEGLSRQYTTWEENFIYTKNHIDKEKTLMMINYNGDIQLLDMSEKYISDQMETRYEGLKPITKIIAMEEEEFFDYIRDYKARGYFALSSFEDELKKKSQCEYDLKYDFAIEYNDKVYIFALYDNGAETELAVRMVEGISTAESMMDNLWNSSFEDIQKQISGD